MSRRNHAQAHLPALDPDEALLFVALLDRVIDAVWRAHGFEMNERMLNRYVGLHDALDPPIDDVSDLPF